MNNLPFSFWEETKTPPSAEGVGLIVVYLKQIKTTLSLIEKFAQQEIKFLAGPLLVPFHTAILSAK